MATSFWSKCCRCTEGSLYQIWSCSELRTMFLASKTGLAPPPPTPPPPHTHPQVVFLRSLNCSSCDGGFICGVCMPLFVPHRVFFLCLRTFPRYLHLYWLMCVYPFQKIFLLCLELQLCFVIVCLPPLLLSVLQEGCASWLWPFLSTVNSRYNDSICSQR